MNHKDLEIIGNIIIPSLGNKKYDGVHLTLKNGENPILVFQFETLLNHPMKLPVILGTFTGIGDVTFLDCFYLGASSGASGNIVKYSTVSYIKGHHFVDSNEISFDSFIVEIPNLLRWFGKSSMSQKSDKNQRTIILTEPDEIIIPVTENLKIKISPSYYESWIKNKTIIEETVFIHFIANNEKIKLNELYDYLKNIIKFFLFIQTKEPLIESIRLIDKSLTHKLNNTEHLVHLELFLEPLKLKSIGAYSNIFFDTYKEIEDEFKTLLKNWYNDNLSTTIELLLSKAFVPNLNPENHFLNICFALESFHRQFYNNQAFSEEEFMNRINLINENIEDKTINKWINEKLKYANEPSFRKRLKELKKYFELLSIEKYKDFIDNVVATRNYFVHRDNDIENRFKGKEIFYATRYLEIILKIILFEALGLPVEKIDRKVILLKNYVENLKIRNS